MPPAGTPVRDRAQRLIDALASRHGSPKFVPHVTLAGGFKSLNLTTDPPSATMEPLATAPSPHPSDATLAARALAESHPAFSKPLEVMLKSVSSGSTYHRCVYALAEVTEELREAAAAAGEAALGVEAAATRNPSSCPPQHHQQPFKPDDTFMPHLSLLYSSDPRAKAEGLDEATAAFAEAFREGGEEKDRTHDEGETDTGTASRSWLSSEIEVWLTEGDVEDWRCEARVPFGKK